MLSDQLTTPTGTPDEDLVTDILEKRKQSDSHLAEWRTKAKTWYALVSGDQWSKEDRAVHEEMGKPCVSFNRTAVMIRAITGAEANNRQEVAYKPRQIGAAPVNDILTDAAKWALEQCDAPDEESDAFRDTAICGYGWTETKMNYEDNPEGMIEISRRDPSCMRYDPRASKRNLSDAKWVQCDDYLDDETIKARWPDASLDGTRDATDQDQEPHDATRAPFYKESATQDVNDDDRLVIHHCWRELQVVWDVTGQPGMDPMTGQPTPPQVTEMPDEEYQVAAERALALGAPLQARRRTKTVYMQAYILGKELLETGVAPCQYGFIYKAITGYRDRESNTFYGIVKDIEDPQRYANKMLSQLLHMINTNAKGGIMVEEGAVGDIRKLEDDWAKTDGVTLVNAGALAGGKIQPKPVPQYPQSIPDLLQFSISSIRDGSGIPLEMLGLADKMQPGIVEEARTQAGLGNVATLFDALRLYRKQHGRLLAHFIIKYIADGRLIRIAGPLAEQYMPLRTTLSVMDYDVVVDVAPTSRDMRQKTYEALMQIAPMVMQQGGPVPEEALDYAPIPSQLAGSWKRQIADAKQQASQKPDPQVQIAQAVMQTEQAKAAQSQAKGQADIQIAQINVQLKHAELQLRQAEAQMKAQEHAQAMELGRLKIQQQENEEARDLIEHLAVRPELMQQ